MNHDQIKTMLLTLKDTKTEFHVILSGKKSSLVNGLYKPDIHEIILHNRNFDSDNPLVYTAVHEYAHHIHCERTNFVSSARSHTNEFWTIFHELIALAEEKGYYKNGFNEADFADLTRKIKTLCLGENGRLMLEFGKLMIEAEKLCRSRGMRFEDYVDRALGVPRTTAYTAMKAFTYDVEPDYGWDAMKLMSGISDPDKRAFAAEAFRTGKPPEYIKASIRDNKPSEDPAKRLGQERARIERTIEHLQARLSEIEMEIAKVESRIQ